MADKEQIKQTAAMVLGFVEKVSSFASSINPLFGIVTSLIGVVRKGLVEDEDKQMDKDFQQIHDKLNSISEKNKQLLKDIHVSEVNETFGRYEEYIKHQYSALNTMVDRIRENPDKADQYMTEFKVNYGKDKNRMNLDVFYDGVMGKHQFGRKLLNVYLEHCDGNRKVMEARCSHLMHLFQIGLITLMAYYSITEDDEDELKDEWTRKFSEIQEKMEEILKQCTN